MKRKGKLKTIYMPEACFTHKKLNLPQYIFSHGMEWMLLPLDYVHVTKLLEKNRENVRPTKSCVVINF